MVSVVEAASKLVDAVLSEGAIGAVVGCSEADETAIEWGPRSADDLLVDKVFEAGSITKTFLAMVLARLSREKVVSLDDQVGSFLPDAVPGVASITLLELATHTSGLPRLPPNLRLGNFVSANPYAHFGTDEMKAGLQLAEVGEKKHQYSNFGFGVLGIVLAVAANEPLVALVDEHVLKPLDLTDTRLTVDGTTTDNEAIGHDTAGTKTSHWDFTPEMAGCGAIRTTITDLLKYSRYMAENNDSLIEILLQPRAPRNGGHVGLAWNLTDEVCWHTGGTGGFGALAAFSRKPRRTVAILANSSHEAWRSADAVALQWLALSGSK